ncbi:MAG TPA: YHS domain-containing protein [Candidatus Limnocylindria bacterium]|nr:YHS domain-containing protein [Candidatus Limnocylindria bacterium]
MDARTRPEADGLEEDPVCGTPVDPDSARDLGLYADDRGVEYVFCGPDCHRAFTLEPERYARVEREEPPAP